MKSIIIAALVLGTMTSCNQTEKTESSNNSIENKEIMESLKYAEQQLGTKMKTPVA